MKPSILSVVAITTALLITAYGGKGPLPPADKTPPRVAAEGSHANQERSDNPGDNHDFSKNMMPFNSR